MTIATVTTALESALATIDGLRVVAFVPDSISPPAIFLGYPEVEYDLTTLGCVHILRVLAYVVLSRVNDRTAYDRLSPFLDGAGPSSVKAAIEADRSLGGAAANVRVSAARVGPMTIAGVEYIAGQLDIEITSGLG